MKFIQTFCIFRQFCDCTMKKYFIAIFLFMLALPQETYLQQDDLKKKIEYKSNELEKIRNEIRQYKKELGKAESKEKSLLEKLQETEKDMSLTYKLFNELTREQRKKENEIQLTEKSIKQMENNLAQLKASFARRLVNLYKKGEMEEWEYLLTSESLNQAIYRYKYFRILADIDRRTAENICYTIRKIENKKQVLETELQDKEKIIVEKKQYQQTLKKQKRQRSENLNAAKKNKKNLIIQLQQKEKAAKELSRLIANLEKEQEIRRKELERQRVLSGVNIENPFLQSRGKLSWPVNGDVIAHFGMQKHPVLNTITENSGIDIKAKQGTPIKAILDGVVATITYIRGFGNTIIIDHGFGFYSVYSHLENVAISENQYISKDMIIASVGDSGTLSGAQLHFEIWKNRTKLNPEEWLVGR